MPDDFVNKTASPSKQAEKFRVIGVCDTVCASALQGYLVAKGIMKAGYGDC